MDTSFLEDKRIFAAAVVVIGLVAAIAMAAILGAGVTEVGLAVGGGIGLAVIVGATYALGLRYGHPHSHAVAEAAIAFGTVYLIAATFRLLTEFGTRSTTEVTAGLGLTLVGTVVLVGAIVAAGRFGPSAA